MRCPRCENDALEEEHDFCFKCGLGLRTNQETTSLPPSQVNTASTDLITQAVQESNPVNDNTEASGKTPVSLWMK